MSDESRRVVLLASDLMMTSSVGGAASGSGLTFQSCSNAPAAAEACAGESVLLLIDLGTPGLDVDELAGALPEEVRSRAVAYGPHVHTTKLQAARDAGIGSVLSRGQFSTQFGQIVAAFADR